MPSLSEQVQEMHSQGLTSSRIARAVGRSRQRISQVLHKLGLQHNVLPAKVLTVRPCCICGNPVSGNRKFCDKCRTVTFTCSICGVKCSIPRHQYDVRLRDRKVADWFCSKRCYGVYFGRHNGFALHPEHMYRTVINPMKRCTRCGETKPRSEFYPYSNRGAAIHSMCRVCSRAYGLEWRLKQKAKRCTP